MLLDKEIEIQLNPKNIAYYEKLGYKIPRSVDVRGRIRVSKGSKLKVKASDLPKGSHEKVEVLCDYCGTLKVISYKDFLRHHDEKLGDCCHKCGRIKYKNTLQQKYGVDNVMSIPGVKEKIILTNRERYGCDYHVQRPEYQKQYEETMRQRYGVNRALQYPDFLEKMNVSRNKSPFKKTTRPQRKLADMLEKIYGNSILEVPCLGYSLDCVVNINNTQFDFEYDGYYWHNNEERDEKRNENVIKSGYKVIRIRGNAKDDMPEPYIIQQTVEEMLASDEKLSYITVI